MAEAFTWGSSGEAETTSSRARRRLAEALMRDGTSGAPVQHWTQGLNRVAQALIGGSMLGDEDARELKQQQDANALIASHPAFAGMGGAAQPAAAPPGVSPGIAKVAAALTGPDHIYSNDEPSPLDPPMGDDRVRMAKTILGEAANEPALGQSAVANVIRNRAVDGSYGGNTPSGVVTAPNQFEPWNTEAGRARMDRAYADPAQRAAADRAIAQAYGEGGMAPNDPTGGHSHFWSPTAQAALGRKPPAWAGGDTVQIGSHVFSSPDDQPGRTQMAGDPAAIPANAQPAQGYVVPGGQPASPQMPEGVANWVRQAIRNPATRGAALGIMQQYSKPRETYRQETDAQGNVWSINDQTGQRAVALKADKPAEAPASVREYEYYKANLPGGQAPMSYDTWATAKARAAATNVTTNVAGNGSEKDIFNEMVDRAKAARTTAAGLTSIRQAREAIDGGAITGFRADERLSLQKAAKLFGVPLSEANKIENSEVFKAAIAPQVASVLRSTVGSANISDSDRRFAERAAGGSLDLDAASISRLLNIMEQASVSHLQQHQETLDAVYPDADKHKRERSLFGVRVTAGGKAAGATQSGIKWSAE